MCHQYNIDFVCNTPDCSGQWTFEGRDNFKYKTVKCSDVGCNTIVAEVEVALCRRKCGECSLERCTDIVERNSRGFWTQEEQERVAQLFAKDMEFARRWAAKWLKDNRKPVQSHPEWSVMNAKDMDLAS